MKWAIKLTTELGYLKLPFNGHYKTKKEAEEAAEKAKDIPGTIKVEILKK